MNTISTGQVTELQHCIFYSLENACKEIYHPQLFVKFHSTRVLTSL